MFGRIQQFDERSRNFAVVPSGKLRSFTWSCDARLDQGREGACVGFAIAHELIARPAKAAGVHGKYARHIYHEAQKIDPWPGGAYPGASPFYEGTSVLAGVKTAQRLGWFKSYYWGFSTEAVLYALGHRGPCVAGLNWYEGMINPDENGFVHPTGKVVSGHCVMFNKISMRGNYVEFPNSWGRAWGIDGTAKISLDDFDRLLREDGEAVFFEHRTTKP